MANRYYQIRNGRIITPSGIVNNGTLLFAGGKIVEITDTPAEVPGAEILDAAGMYVAPGCIDTHVHGGAGHDFLETTPEAFVAIAEAHAAHGTTTLYPTLAVAPPEVFYRAFDVFEQVKSTSHNGACMPGLHLEGNYINPLYKGAQDPRYITLPRPDEYGAMLAYTDCIKRWSAAPELPGALEFARYVTERGVVVSLAHTGAVYEQVRAAYEAGFTHVTHFYNAMQGVHKQREFKREGTVESVYLIDGMSVEVIADGVHLPPAVLRLVHKFKGADCTALVTDCCAAGAGAAGEKCFDPRVIIEDGVAKLSDRSALAGSIATTDRLLRTLVKEAGIPLEDAVKMASATPARVMKIDGEKGTLEKGKDADIILFDNDITVHATFVGGKAVYRSSSIL